VDNESILESEFKIVTGFMTKPQGGCYRTINGNKFLYRLVLV
jgi:hypothetical protein